MSTSRRPPRPVVHLPIAAVDRLARGGHVIGVIGPLELPPRDALVEALYRIMSLGPEARLGLVGTPDGHDWRYDPQALRARCDRMVVERDADDGLSSTTYAERMVAEIDPDLPLRIVVVGDRLITIYDHQLVDARYTTGLPAALIALATGGDMPSWLTVSSARRPLAAGVVATFLRHPGQIARLLRARRVIDPDNLPRTSAERPLVPWCPSSSVVWAQGTRQDYREFRAWLRAQDGAPSFGAAVIVALRRSLAEVGIRLDPMSEMVYDVRRYLPAGVETTGNFVTGIPVDGGDDLGAVENSIHETVESGRPLAALLAGAAKEALGLIPRGTTDSAPAHARAHVVVSNMGLTRALQQLPWRRDGRPAQAVYLVHPMGPESVAAQIAVIDGAVQASVTFNDNVFDRETIERAVTRAIADPLSLLAADAGYQPSVVWRSAETA